MKFKKSHSTPKNLVDFAKLLLINPPISFIEMNKTNNWGYEKSYIKEIRDQLVEYKIAKVSYTENEKNYLVKTINTDEFIRKNKRSSKIKQSINENAMLINSMHFIINTIKSILY